MQNRQVNLTKISYIESKLKYWIARDSVYLEIDDDDRLRFKLQEKQDVFNFPIINFQFICRNILEVSAYSVYVSIRYSKTYAEYCWGFLDLKPTELLSVSPGGG